jgi:cyclopropane-fatty-acyl-phospholipid synthase
MVTQFTHPSLDALGAAFVEGKLELEGSISEVIRVCDELSQALLRRTMASASAYRPRQGNRRQSHFLPLRPVQCVLSAVAGQRHGVFLRLFRNRQRNPEQAQQAKFRHLCRKLRLQPGDYLLDVGCGWGGLARYAAREFGAKVFGITLSKEQLALARERVKEEGLEDQVELQLLDYRDLPQDGRFDKVVSVGMFEHVGHANLEYCKVLFGAVKEGGLVMNHGITAKHTDGRPVGRGAGISSRNTYSPTASCRTWR